MSENHKQKQHQEEPSPILGSWKNVYLMLVSVLITIILLLYWFTKHFEA